MMIVVGLSALSLVIQSVQVLAPARVVFPLCCRAHRTRRAQLLYVVSRSGPLRFRARMQRLSEFFDFRGGSLRNSLQQRVLRHTHHFFRQQRGLDLSQLLQRLPLSSQRAVYQALYRNELSRCAFFKVRRCHPLAALAGSR
jgi:hypothetical protein